MRRKSPMEFFANPYVILADVMVSLSFILALFLLVRTVDFELLQRISERNQRRNAMGQQFVTQLKAASVVPQKLEREQRGGNKYAIVAGKKVVLLVQDDGIFAQRFRLLSGALEFKTGSANFQSPQLAVRSLEAIAQVLTTNRDQIKTLTIEGYARPGERNAWGLSQLRAEKVRQIWTQKAYLEDVKASYQTPVFRWMERQKLWERPQKPFTQWHLQEYLAARRTEHFAQGVIPLAWVVTAGRGDSGQKAWQPETHGAVVEFRLEYVERSAPPLDKFLQTQPENVRRQARSQGLMR